MITYCKISEKGSRKVNEDSVKIAVSKNKINFMVCDGLGGHGGGDIASRIAVDEFEKAFEGYDGNPSAYFEKAFLNAQNGINGYQKSNPSVAMMKTTVTSLIIDRQNYSWGYIGDSRIYCFENGKAIRMTSDHSVPGMLVKAGDIEESEIRFHPDRNKLLRALGEENAPRYVSSEYSPCGDKTAFLLCSDGFWEYVTEEEMEKTLAESKSVSEWLTMMRDIVVKNGEGRNADNFSAVAVWRGNALDENRKG